MVIFAIVYPVPFYRAGKLTVSPHLWSFACYIKKNINNYAIINHIISYIGRFFKSFFITFYSIFYRYCQKFFHIIKKELLTLTTAPTIYSFYLKGVIENGKQQ